MMRFRTRVFIALGFIAAFLIAAPPLVLYTSGYRYDWNRREWFNPGWIILETQPAKAAIFLNGRGTGLKTPATLKNLRPDDYLVEVKLEGHHSWQKRLKVEPGMATFAKHMKLFKISQPKILSIKEGGENSKGVSESIFWHQAITSPDLKKIALIRRQILNQPSRFGIFNLQEGQIKEIETDGQQVEEIVWDEKGENALIKFSGNKFNLYESSGIFGESGFKPLSIPSLDNWQLLTSRNELWGIKNDRLFKIDLSSGKINLVTTIPALKNFKVMGEKVYVLRDLDQTNSTYLSIAKEDGKEKIISRLPKSKYFFINGGDRLILIDQSNSQLYVLRPNGDDLVLPEFIASATGAVWSKDERLLYWNDFEIWIWDARNNQKDLINRLGEKIILTRWYSSQDYILFATSEEVRVTELDSRDKRNIMTLTKISPTQNAPSEPVELMVEEKGEKIFLLYSADNGLVLAEQEIL